MIKTKECKSELLRAANALIEAADKEHADILIVMHDSNTEEAVSAITGKTDIIVDLLHGMTKDDKGLKHLFKLAGSDINPRKFIHMLQLFEDIFGSDDEDEEDDNKTETDPAEGNE